MNANIRFVDLGLTSGTLWDNKNIGADHITDAGIYISFPETFFYKDKNYHIPTKGQFEELIRECKWKWIEENGMFGYRITGKNGAYIFLPAAGYFNGTSLYRSGTYGVYWSTTCRYGFLAHYLYFDSYNVGIYSNSQCRGMQIRLVTNSTYE